MSARERILERLWWSVPSENDEQAKRIAERWLDDYAHELSEEIKGACKTLPEGGDWFAGMYDAAKVIEPKEKS